MGLANTLALTLGGISRNSENPNGGAIVRNNDGGNSFLIFIYHSVSLFRNADLVKLPLTNDH